MLQKFVVDIDTSNSETFEVQHGFGTDVIVQVSQVHNGEVVIADVYRKDGVVQIRVGGPCGMLRIIVIG